MINVRAPRDKALAPMLRLATRYNITPNMVSIAGIVSMVLFGIITYLHIYYASLAFLAISVIADLLDGSIARFQKISTDSGKKIDLVADNVTFTIFMITLGLTHLISLWVAIVIIILQIIVTVKSTKKAIASTSHTGLRIHEIQGFWISISLVKAIMYVSFVIEIFSSTTAVPIMRLVALFILAFGIIRK